MRKIWTGLLIAGLVVSSAAVGAVAADSVRKSIEVEYKGIQITVDGQTVSTPDEPFIYVEKSRTFIPARPLAEAMGAKVGWDGNTNTVQVYSKNYATQVRDGDYTNWTMPASGFSVRTPKDFMRIELPLAMLQLNAADPVTLTGSLVFAVQPMEDLSGTGTDKMNFLIYTLKSTLLPGATATDINEANGLTTAHGTATYLGSTPVTFTLRLVPAGNTDWALIALSPTVSAQQNQPLLDAMLNSFTLQQ